MSNSFRENIVSSQDSVSENAVLQTLEQGRSNELANPTRIGISSGIMWPFNSVAPGAKIKEQRLLASGHLPRRYWLGIHWTPYKP